MVAARASALASDIAAKAPVAVHFAKQLIDGGTGLGLANALESLTRGLTASNVDGREGVAAFREKRPARFKGLL